MVTIQSQTLRSAVQPGRSVTPLVYIVDDDVSVRESLEALVLSYGWRAEAHDCATSFLLSPRADVPNCLILDLNLPDVSGLEVQTLIRKRAETPIIFITGDLDIPPVVQAMKAGACEYLLKPFPDDELLDAMENCFEQSHLALAKRADLERNEGNFRSLSRRERQIMYLVTEGLLNKQVAFELGISEITVKAHRGQVMRKMNARSLADLVLKARMLEVEMVESIRVDWPI